MDHYAVLGVERGATGAAIRVAYRKAATIHHPDKGGDPEFLKKLPIEVLGDDKGGAADATRSSAVSGRASTGISRPTRQQS